MEHEVAFQVLLIIALGVAGQWLAWRFRLPAIVVLLGLGALSGPGLKWLSPDHAFGELLFPFVSLSVAVILFEGGLRLRFRELRGVGRVLVFLLTVGVAISWLTTAVAGHYFLQLAWPVAFLLGAILVVTGPTVINPILRHLRLRGRVGALLKWEGIIVDPLGATLAVLVFAAIQTDTFHFGLQRGALQLLLTVVSGGGIGIMAGLLLGAFVSRFWVPDFLVAPITLLAVFAAFLLANLCQDESGLLAVTVFGIVLANQRRFPIRNLLEFKEALTVLLISSLFIVLAARLNPAAILSLGWKGLLFVLVLLVIGRPAGVFLSSLGSEISWSERWFLAFMAPRGIVAAAVSSVMALGLEQAGYPMAERIVAATFLTVFAAAVFYGLIASPLARILKLVHPNPQGILFVGADSWIRELATTLREEGIPVCLVDTNWHHVKAAKMANLPVVFGSALASAIREKLDYTGLGRLLAVTPNDEVNSLACMVYAEDFGQQEVYQLPFSRAKEGPYEAVPLEHRGRMLFCDELTFSQIVELQQQGFKIKKTKITEEFTYLQFRAQYGEPSYLLFVLKPGGRLVVCTAGTTNEVSPGDIVIALVRTQQQPNSTKT